jgi:hypothetical protein
VSGTSAMTAAPGVTMFLHPANGWWHAHGLTMTRDDARAPDGAESKEDFDADQQARDPRGRSGPANSSLPGWFKFGCGGGCLALILVVAILGMKVSSYARELVSPETQWASLREQLHFEEQPVDLTLELHSILTALIVDRMGDAKMYTLVSADSGYRAAVTITPLAAGAGEGIHDMYESQHRIEDYSGDMDGQRNIQGRVVYARSGVDGALTVVLYSRDSSIVVMLEDTRGGGLLTDAQIDGFFDHFDVWR